jgi:FkbM family methyltransferase
LNLQLALFNYLNDKFCKNRNFVIKNIGLSNQKGKRIFYDYKLSSQSSFYKLNKNFQSLGEINKKYYVNFYRLDSILKKIGFIDLCKIDAQGEDLNILKGMSLILKKRLIKIIKIELSFINFYEKNDLNYLDIINFLLVYKYKLINISKIKYFKNQIGFCDAYFELSK